jgi:hypothetical protein
MGSMVYINRSARNVSNLCLGRNCGWRTLSAHEKGDNMSVVSLLTASSHRDAVQNTLVKGSGKEMI